MVIPQDLSVAGFDDTPIATKIWPPLTTVRQPIAEMSELATSRLIQTLREQDDVRESGTTHVPFTIVERESTGPARS
jgi:LacI family transcriptional regulator